MINEKLESNVVEAPTIFIGVGGTGSKIVKKVYQHCSPEERERVGFVCLDTNVNDLRDIQGGAKDITIVQTSSTQTVGSYLDRDKDASQHWFPKNAVIYDKTVSEGAGQLRAISRLALNATIKTGRIQPLYDAIDALFKKTGEELKQALRCCIVSTASGGTGSGMLLPFCMVVRDYVNNKYPNASVILRTLILLPETLDSVITSNIEKESQRRNAYATIKELNAFMMKGSGFCNIEPALRRYEEIHVDVTNPGQGDMKRLSLLPCDFCFLLDGQDAEDSTANSFEQYKEQAALALYEQMIGPMQKNAFSVEDNIIKELANPGNYGRNRFGGIGAGRIIYPYDDIVNYVAYDWARDSIGGSGDAAKWLLFDNEVKRQNEEDEKAERSINERDSDGKIYANALIQKADGGNNKFAKNLVQKYNLHQAEERVTLFLQSFEDAVVDAVNQNKGLQECKGYWQGRSEKLYEKPDNWSAASDDAANLRDYYDIVKNLVKRLTKTSADGILYNDAKTMVAKEKAQYLESLLKYGNEICHPNAARYMLYLLEEEVKNGYKDINVDAEQGTIASQLGDWEKLHELPHDKEKRSYKSYEDMATIIVSLGRDGREEKRSKKIINDAMKDIKGMYGLVNQISDLESLTIRKVAYEVLMGYLEEINKEYKKFFDDFNKKVQQMESKQEEICSLLKYKKGNSIKYVCSQKAMLDELSRETRTSMEKGQMLDNELNAQLFDQVKKNVQFKRETLYSDDVIVDARVDIFDGTLLEYFRNKIYSECKKSLDLNIIEAIAKEPELLARAEARKKCTKKDEKPSMQAISDKERMAHIKAVIATGEKLSAPGVQRIIGEEPREINVCAYNKVLKEMREYRMDELLVNGAACSTVSKYELHYFNALYNLTPDKLVKFCAPKSTETGEKVAGMYHSAYTNYTKDIGPDCLKSSKITTHIDRRWDSIAAMPELDLEYQQQQFLRTHKAMVYGLLFKRIVKQKYQDGNSNEAKSPAMAYRYTNTRNSIEDMIVTNGTLCDEFYEILDSLYIDRALVEDIYTYERMETAKDIMRKVPYSKTKFNEDYVQKFEMEYEVCKDEEGRAITEKIPASLFEIPLAYYNSLPSSLRDPEELSSLVDGVIDVLRVQIMKYESVKNTKFILCDHLKQQYDLLISNYEKYPNYLSAGIPKEENKLLEVVERKVREIMETSPQPENFEETVLEMEARLKHNS